MLADAGATQSLPEISDPMLQPFWKPLELRRIYAIPEPSVKFCSTIVAACLRRPPDQQSVPISAAGGWVAAWAVGRDKEEAAAGAAEAVGGEAGAKRRGSWCLPALIRSQLSVY
jgi:hypothetical protein